jgi:hypothetical protein
MSCIYLRVLGHFKHCTSWYIPKFNKLISGIYPVTSAYLYLRIYHHDLNCCSGTKSDRDKLVVTGMYFVHSAIHWYIPVCTLVILLFSCAVGCLNGSLNSFNWPMPIDQAEVATAGAAKEPSSIAAPQFCPRESLAFQRAASKNLLVLKFRGAKGACCRRLVGTYTLIHSLSLTLLYLVLAVCPLRFWAAAGVSSCPARLNSESLPAAPPAAPTRMSQPCHPLSRNDEARSPPAAQPMAKAASESCRARRRSAVQQSYADVVAHTPQCKSHPQDSITISRASRRPRSIFKVISS